MFQQREEFDVNSKVICCVANVSKQKIAVYTPLANFSLVSIPKKVCEITDFVDFSYNEPLCIV